MITETAYKSYFENLATKHQAIQHSSNTPAFFLIDNTYDLSSIDQGIRNLKKDVILVCDLPIRRLNDNQANSYYETVDCIFMILTKVSDKTTITTKRDEVLPIVNDFIVRMKLDAKSSQLFNDKMKTLSLSNNDVQPVGPINAQWYGYQVNLSIICPLALSKVDANWLP